MQQHVGHGERLFIVPGLKVQEPVPWGQVPDVIEAVKQHIASLR